MSRLPRLYPASRQPGRMSADAPGHYAGCTGLPHAHVERVGESRNTPHRFRVVLRCACASESRVVSREYAQFETAAAVQRQIEGASR